MEVKQAMKAKPATPRYASIPHAVMDSDAYCDLRGASLQVLMTIVRQMNGHNNGQIGATYSWARRYGIGSEDTLGRAIEQLIDHGLIFRTHSVGANRRWAKYAVTWLPIQDKTDLFIDGFMKDAWKDHHAK